MTGGRERLEVQVLENVDAVRHQQMHVPEQRHLGVGIALGQRIPRHVVGAHRHDALSAAHRLPDFDTPAAAR